MSNTVIMWQPVIPKGEKLACPEPDLFVLQMSTAFPGESWPKMLTAKDLPKLEGMAAATQMVGNPFLKLVESLRKYSRVEVWPEFGEGAF